MVEDSMCSGIMKSYLAIISKFDNKFGGFNPDSYILSFNKFNNGSHYDLKWKLNFICFMD
ncbi:hypothetical protein XBP1_1160002 [Xenorhabdus bovienii str. puntauvense]|uniref:Uncharacterized protein n=1 Tax=Xenorhabdus bovienii str. puntauvense TaxID=1398201 RepID=A0A077N8A7_XENBV|nr:hypothetical protein XBP1_1160002 [Xenorhabdus bovienii str. puntauvense]